MFSFFFFSIKPPDIWTWLDGVISFLTAHDYHKMKKFKVALHLIIISCIVVSCRGTHCEWAPFCRQKFFSPTSQSWIMNGLSEALERVDCSQFHGGNARLISGAACSEVWLCKSCCCCTSLCCFAHANLTSCQSLKGIQSLCPCKFGISPKWS